MAVIKFKADQQQSLSGTLCGMIYRTRNGKTSVFTEPVPFMPKRPTEAQRLKYHKDCVVQDCTQQIQSLILARTDRSVAEMQRVADMHNAIRTTVTRWYEKYRPYFRTDTELSSAIVYYFRTKNLYPELDLRLGSPTDASVSASGGESPGVPTNIVRWGGSGGIGRFDERETLSLCDSIAERVWNLVEGKSEESREQTDTKP